MPPGQGIRIIGDAPIFVAHDRAAAGRVARCFVRNPTGSPSLVAGVPPDYFRRHRPAVGESALYRWDTLAAEGYTWWIDRLRTVLSHGRRATPGPLPGLRRVLGHPGDAPKRRPGRWEPGPGIPFFTAVEHVLGRLPIIAEYFGVITPDVVALRDHFGFPGMPRAAIRL